MLIRNKYSLVFIVLAALVPARTMAQLNKAYFFNQARLFLSKNQNTEAIATINQLIAADSTLAEVWLLRGAAKYGLNDLRGAIADFDRAIWLNPVYTYAYLYRGSAHGQLGAVGYAIRDYNMVLELRPNSPEALMNRGISFLNAQRFESALADFNRVIAIEPKNADAWTHKGTSQLFLSDTAGAISSFSLAIMLKPSQAEAYSRRGRLFFELNRFSDALNDLNTAIDLEPASVASLFTRALTHASLGNNEPAIADLGRAIELSPNNALSYFNRALLFWKNGRRTEAYADFTRASELNPSNILVYYNRAVLAIEMNRPGSSLSDLTRAIELLPEFTRAYLVRAQLYHKMGNRSHSERDYRKAMELAQKHSENMNQWADTSERYRKFISFHNQFSSPIQSRTGLSTTGLLPMFRVVARAKEKASQHDAFSEIDSLNARSARFQFHLSTVSPIYAIAAPADASLPSLEIGLANVQNRSLNQRYTETVAALRELLLLFPNNPLLKLNLAAELAEMALFIASFNQEIGPQSIDLFNVSLESTRKTKPPLTGISVEEPLSLLRQLADEYPRWAQIHYNIATILALTGDWQGALEQLNRCLSLNSTIREAHYNKGYILLMLGKTNEGCINFSKAGELGLNAAYDQINRNCQ